MYESDITRFLKALKKERPQLEAEQRKGRAIFWDKVQDLEVNERDRASRVAQPAYVYQPKE